MFAKVLNTIIVNPVGNYVFKVNNKHTRTTLLAYAFLLKVFHANGVQENHIEGCIYSKIISPVNGPSSFLVTFSFSFHYYLF